MLFSFCPKTLSVITLLSLILVAATPQLLVGSSAFAKLLHKHKQNSIFSQLTTNLRYVEHY